MIIVDENVDPHTVEEVIMTEEEITDVVQDQDHMIVVDN